MADKYEDLLLLGAAACCTYVLRKKKRKRRPRFWIHPVIANRNDQGDYQHLIQELRSDPVLFRRYFWLSDLISSHVNARDKYSWYLIERSDWSTQLAYYRLDSKEKNRNIIGVSILNATQRNAVVEVLFNNG